MVRGTPTSLHLTPTASITVMPTDDLQYASFMGAFTFGMDEIVNDFDDDFLTQGVRAYATTPSLTVRLPTAVANNAKTCTTGRIEFWVMGDLRFDGSRAELPVVSASAEPDDFGIVDVGDCSVDGGDVLAALGPQVASAWIDPFRRQSWLCQ